MKAQTHRLPSVPLLLLILHSFAEQPSLQAQAPRLYPGHSHHIALSEANTGTPFIRPIAPMGPLFAKDDFFRTPFSDLALHSGPVRLHSRPATRQVNLHPQADTHSGADPELHPGLQTDLHPGPSPSVLTTDSLTPLGHLIYEHTSVSPLSVSPAAPKPLSFGVMPAATISPARALQIQAALVQSGYLTGTPSGSWDATSIAAMRKLQSDHRWQTKFMPDARALILLGLGPGSQAP